MVRNAVLMLLVMGSPLAAQTDSPDLNWVTANAPHGFDITPDGDIWINLSKVGKKDDYAVRADDLKQARETHNKFPSFWVRGYHKRNPKARYRVSKTRYTVSCFQKTISTSTIAYYDAEDNMLWREGSTFAQDIIPGTYGDEYYRLFCVP